MAIRKSVATTRSQPARIGYSCDANSHHGDSADNFLSCIHCSYIP